jgi:carboxypeptidase C (cathepsin A)
MTTIRRSVAALLLTLGVGATCAMNSAAWGANDAPPPQTAPPAAKPPEKTSLEPFLPPKSVHQSAVIGNKKVEYVLTVGAIPLKDDKGEITGEVVYTSYVVPASAGPSRPVTFSMNGGPGAASAYLNLGALGPKHVNFGRDGTYASDSPALSDNANSWLDFTDLVFIDPIGTGYSRSHLDEDGTVKTFLKPEEDIHYLGDIIDAWLRLNSRTQSPKYLIGAASTVRAGRRRVRHHHGLPRARSGQYVPKRCAVSDFVDDRFALDGRRRERAPGRGTER